MCVSAAFVFPMNTLKLSRTLRLLCFVVPLGVHCFPAQAQSSSQKEKTFWQQIKKFDRLVSQGSVSYTRQIKEGKSTQLFRYALQYDAKPRYVEQIVLPGVGAMAGSVAKTVFDGTDSFSINGNTVVISAGLPFKTDLSYFWALGVYAKPSLPMGRGLSQLRNPRVAFNGRWATVKGTLTDGTSVVAQVDTGDHFLVRKASRFGKNGPLISVMTNTGTLSNGLSAAKSAYTHENVIETTTFTSARFNTPNPSLFHFPLRGNLTILDQRLGKSALATKSSSGEISKGQLLQMTRASLQKMSQQQGQEISAQKTQSLINIFVMVLPGLLFGSWFFLTRMKKTKPRFNFQPHEKPLQ